MVFVLVFVHWIFLFISETKSRHFSAGLSRNYLVQYPAARWAILRVFCEAFRYLAACCKEVHLRFYDILSGHGGDAIPNADDHFQQYKKKNILLQ
jgi:hypothetical protein